MSAGHDLSTLDGYRDYLETNGSSPHMIEEILAVYFPNGATTHRFRPTPEPAGEPKRSAVRRAVPVADGQLALDLDGAAAATPAEAAAPALFAPTGEHPASPGAAA